MVVNRLDGMSQDDLDRKFHEKFKDMKSIQNNEKRKTWDEYFLDLADMVASRSTCNRAHHGAVLVDGNHRIISTGYNGSPPGYPHCEDEGCIEVNNHCVRTKGHHSEDNCIEYMDQMEWDFSVGYTDLTLYVTANPCSLCMDKIRKHPEIDCVVYRNSYYDGRFRPIGIHKYYP